MFPFSEMTGGKYKVALDPMMLMGGGPAAGHVSDITVHDNRPADDLARSVHPSHTAAPSDLFPSYIS